MSAPLGPVRLPVLPEPVAASIAALADGCRRVEAWLDTVGDVRVLTEALDWVVAVEAYLAKKNAQGPAQTTARLLEARIGEMLGPPENRGPATVSRDSRLERYERHDFRRMAAYRPAWVGRLPLARREVLRLIDIAETVGRIAAEPQPLPSGPFRVIVADPPWRYEARAEDATHRARTPYPNMSVAQIAALPVAAIANDDAVLWLWTTNAFIEEAFEVCRAWGFVSKTMLTWAKDRMGTGTWLRGQTEHCLFAARGRPTISLTNQTTLLQAPRREHSRKPDEFFALVESLCPGSKLELFARAARPGWQRWGADAPREGAA